MSDYPSGTSKANRFSQDDYHLWYVLRFKESVSIKSIADKFECSYQHIRKKTQSMKRGGYEEILEE